MKNFLKKIDEYIAGLVLAFMLLIVFVNVLSRYWLHASISFTDELTTNFAVLLSMFGAAIAAKRGAHLGLTLLTDALPPKWSNIIIALGNILGGVFCLLAAYYGFFMAEHQFSINQLSPCLNIPVWIFGSFIPIGTTVIAVQFFIKAAKLIKGKEEENA